MPETWGNPDTKSYKNNYIRRTIVDGGMLSVHKNIVDYAEELLIRISAAGVVFFDEMNLPTTLDGYSEVGSDKKRLGLEFSIPTNKDLTGLGDDLGFESRYVTPNMDFVFIGVEKEPELPSYIDEVSDKIGAVKVGLGHHGKNVAFIHYFLGFPEERLTFDEKTLEATKAHQARMGLPVRHGEWDSETWKSVIPKKHKRITGGDAGMLVRAAQAALRANGYFCPLTSRFGTETVKSIRQFQEANNLRTTGRIGMSEWDLLFYYI